MADDIETTATADAPVVDVQVDQIETTDAPVIDPPSDVQPDWREDWRDKMAGGDEKELKRLQRFKSPVDVYKSARELEKKMSSGDIKAKLPDGATDDQTAAWRKENGIPDTPDGYLAKLPSGLVIGEADKPMIDGFMSRMHGKNVAPEVVAEAVDWYYAQQSEALAAQATSDKAYRVATEDALRAEWGGEFRGNINAAMALLDAAPAAEDGTPFKTLMFGARLSDGTPLGNHPAALKWLTQMAGEINPSGFVSPGSDGSQLQSVKEEIAKIEKDMRTDRRSYDKDAAKQERLRTLYDADAKLSAKG